MATSPDYEGLEQCKIREMTSNGLPSENLYDIARNSSAVHRKVAIQLLVERGSLLACREEIATEARQFVLSNPLVIKKIDPAAAAFAATKLPGVVDCIADGLTSISS
jgi:hypothetical protein